MTLEKPAPGLYTFTDREDWSWGDNPFYESIEEVKDAAREYMEDYDTDEVVVVVLEYVEIDYSLGAESAIERIAESIQEEFEEDGREADNILEHCTLESEIAEALKTIFKKYKLDQILIATPVETLRRERTQKGEEYAEEKKGS